MTQPHHDCDIDDLDAAQELPAGAVAPDHQAGETFRVYLDPAGHLSCLGLPGSPPGGVPGGLPGGVPGGLPSSPPGRGRPPRPAQPE